MCSTHNRWYCFNVNVSLNGALYVFVLKHFTFERCCIYILSRIIFRSTSVNDIVQWSETIVEHTIHLKTKENR